MGRSHPHSSDLPEEVDADSFCSSLSNELTSLEQSLAESSTISLQWSAEAMSLVKRVQVELLTLFRKSQLPIISFGSDKEDWFDHYMKQTVILLDLCNSLKSAVSSITRYRMVVDITISQSFHTTTAVTTKKLEEFERLEKDELKNKSCDPEQWKKWGRNMRPLENGIVALIHQRNKVRCRCKKKKKKDDDDINVVMLVVKSTMVVVSSLLSCAFVSVEIGRRFRFPPSTETTNSSLVSLVDRFQEKMFPKGNGNSKSGTVAVLLAEHELVVRLVGDLKDDQLAQQGILLMEGEEGKAKFLTSALQRLREGSLILKEKLVQFDSAVDEVFEVVIRGRNEMLGMVRDGHFTF